MMGPLAQSAHGCHLGRGGGGVVHQSIRGAEGEGKGEELRRALLVARTAQAMAWQWPGKMKESEAVGERVMWVGQGLCGPGQK